MFKKDKISRKLLLQETLRKEHLKKQIRARSKLKASLQEGLKEFKYFNIIDHLDLKKYDSYMFITPRNIGKSTSCWEVIVDWYEETGDYGVWVRTSETEKDVIKNDHKNSPPKWWKPHYKVKGDYVIDTSNKHGEDNNIVCVFKSLSTLGNTASVTGGKCGIIVYDEFLKRDKTMRNTRDIYRIFVDFMKTMERYGKIIVLFMANATTMNNEFLTRWNINKDTKIIKNTKDGFYFVRITEWDKPPVMKNVSTADKWATNDLLLKSFMDSGDVLDINSTQLVVPENIFTFFVNIEQYLLNEVPYTYSITNKKIFVIREGHFIPNGKVYPLTNSDNVLPYAKKVKVFNPWWLISKIDRKLKLNKLVFTSHNAKSDIINYIVQVKGNLPKEEEKYDR